MTIAMRSGLATANESLPENPSSMMTQQAQLQPVPQEQPPAVPSASPSIVTSVVSTSSTSSNQNPSERTDRVSSNSETTSASLADDIGDVCGSGGSCIGEPDFPHVELGRLDEMINRPRWVVPVLPKGELEVLLDASLDLCKRGLDVRSEACQHFFRDGLTLSFTKILTDDAVSGWKFEIHRCIMKNCERLIELCVTKLVQDWFPLLDLLAMVLNPSNKFHTYNGTRPSESVPLGSQIPEEELFARPPDARTPKGWLVDLINKFGQLGGFQMLLDRFRAGPSLSVALIAALIRPFGLCHELLTVNTIEKYFLPIVDAVPMFLDNLSDDELNKEAKNEAKNDALSAIIKALKCLVSRVPTHEDTAKSLEVFRLKMILRLLQISPFNGKMNALNEVNKLIGGVSHNYSHRHSIEEDDWLTAERMADWIKENRVLQIVLRDNLHQPQYVEKLEKIIRFIIKEKTLTVDDLDSIWAAQAGKHEAIVKNVHDLLAKLAWDFSPEQLDHLFDCFQSSWTNASKKQREKLLELIRRLAEDDKDGVMAHKVLSLLWSLAHSDDVPTEIMDQALSAHAKILDYSCSQDRDAQKTQWLDKCVEELKNDKWVLPALKQIREICCLYMEAPPNCNHAQQRTPHTYYRHDIINRLQQQHSLVMLIAENLTNYMAKARAIADGDPNLDPHAIWPDGRYSHVQEVQERLHFLRFLLKDGQLWLCAPQAQQTWQCLAENAVFVTDRESCFKWFSKLMGDEPDLDPEINKEFFENNILQLDPCLLTENGMKCFDRFFKAVNTKEGKLLVKRRQYQMDDVELIGQDYLWRVVLCGNEDIASRAIQLLKETYTNLSPKLTMSQLEIHEDFVQSCTDRLRAAYDTISVLDGDKDSLNRVRQETTRMVRVLTVLREYIAECDGDHGEERTILPMARAQRGKHVSLVVRFPNQGRQVDDMEIWTHTNDTLASVRRQILARVKVNNANMKMELIVNGEQLEPDDDKKLISQIPIRDKTVMTAKLCQMSTNMPSSPDSSSDSSTGSPQRPFEGPSVEAENCLPSVLMAHHSMYAQFLFQLADLGSSLDVAALRDGARAILDIMPADGETERKLRSLCVEFSTAVDQTLVSAPSLESNFFASSPSHVLYNLEVTYALLMPALDPMSAEALELQYNFIRSGGVSCVLGLLTKNNFLPNADVPTKRAAYLVVLKICKLMLTVVAHAIVQVAVNNVTCPTDGPQTKMSSPGGHNHAVILQQALHHIPNPNADCMLRNVASRLAQHLLDQAVGPMPDSATIRSIVRISWASSCGAMHMVHSSMEDLHRIYEMLSQVPVSGDDKQQQQQQQQQLQQQHASHSASRQPESEDNQVCKEALELLTLSLALHPQGVDALTKEKFWQQFVVDLTLICRNRSIRISAAEQFFLIATKCSPGHHPMLFFITLLLTILGTTVEENAKNSHEYFQLLCRLLNCAFASNCHLPAVENQLAAEVAWLKKIRSNVMQTGDIQVEEALLEGHLGVARELVFFLRPEAKHDVGSNEKKEYLLIKELLEDFLFPASKVMLQYQKTGEMASEVAVPVCSTPQTVVAAFDLLVSLVTGCVPNLRVLAAMLTEIYDSERGIDRQPIQPLTEWEYLPPIGPRPSMGFVGLKNAGATCYMNSVLQQLYMIERIRDDLLAVEGACDDPDEDFSGEEKSENEFVAEPSEGDGLGTKKQMSVEESRKEYNRGVLKQIQAIFGHLAGSKLQYYVPRGLWKHFKLGGEPVNLREQHDALEFFNSLVDSVDEALKTLGHEQLLSSVLGGSFADQKICKGCPHRYSREESFTTLNIDIRNHSNLLDSLEQYVKGDLLEGANAYHCERCSKKVDTVKRMCIKKLPPILAIQLKRFDYDWERECAVKFNDYFEFPRELDMGPYTVSGLAKLERDAIPDENDADADARDSSHGDSSVHQTTYKLTGIVVHSGQASGGHYYSYVLHRCAEGVYKWYKFDDGEVVECKMDDDEEMKVQCFGGDYMGEVFDHMLKRMSYRRQKRWWNAYILFYTRHDVDDELLLAKSMQEMSLSSSDSRYSPTPRMPAAIARSVCRQNIRFIHNRNQFSVEYFQFMKKLVSCNAPYIAAQLQQQQQQQQQNPSLSLDKQSAEAEELAMISIMLASNFLFSTGFHTKKTLRGSALDWCEALCVHLRNSRSARLWFANDVLFAHPHRFCEYLLECPTSEVRTAFVKIIVCLAHFSHGDGPWTPPGTLASVAQTIDPNATLSDHLLHAVLSLLKKEVSEHGRHLTQYFTLFLMYSSLGIEERKQLLKLNVPATFMLVALDDGPGPPIKYQYAELGKMYQVVSQLVRCCDVSSKMQTSMNNKPVMPNVHGDPDCPEYIMPIQPQVADILYGRPSYVKKIIEDANTAEDTLKLLTFCSWENPHFSSMVLSELLWQIAYSYTYELRPYLDLLLRMLVLEDSWQNHRIHNALKGIPDDREGLFDTIQRSKNHYQKRAYQCIKCMVLLFGSCPAATHMLHSNGDMKRKWTWAVEWLNGELERRPYSTNAPYAYNNWSPPTQSNETSNGYFLERSHSARMTLTKAIALCPEEDQEEQDLQEESEGQQPDAPDGTKQQLHAEQGQQQQPQQLQSPPPSSQGPQQPINQQQLPSPFQGSQQLCGILQQQQQQQQQQQHTLPKGKSSSSQQQQKPLPAFIEGEPVTVTSKQQQQQQQHPQQQQHWSSDCIEQSSPQHKPMDTSAAHLDLKIRNCQKLNHNCDEAVDVKQSSSSSSSMPVPSAAKEPPNNT